MTCAHDFDLDEELCADCAHETFEELRFDMWVEVRGA